MNKSKATPHQVRTARTTFTIRNRSGGRRALGVVAGLAKKGYRPDLRAVSILFSLGIMRGIGSSTRCPRIGHQRKRTLVRTRWKTPPWCMKVERGHVCNINAVRLPDSHH